MLFSFFYILAIFSQLLNILLVCERELFSQCAGAPKLITSIIQSFPTGERTLFTFCAQTTCILRD